MRFHLILFADCIFSDDVVKVPHPAAAVVAAAASGMLLANRAVGPV